tara:strand:+ start:85 stop:330 length:246 start_codon:yes stop_codon:yes gene_type:complete
MGIIEVILKLIQRKFDRSGNKEKKKSSSIMIQVIALSVFPLFYSLTLLPPGVTAMQVVFACLAFLLIVVFAVKVLQYFKIM